MESARWVCKTLRGVCVCVQDGYAAGHCEMQGRDRASVQDIMKCMGRRRVGVQGIVRCVDRC